MYDIFEAHFGLRSIAEDIISLVRRSNRQSRPAYWRFRKRRNAVRRIILQCEVVGRTAPCRKSRRT